MDKGKKVTRLAKNLLIAFPVFTVCGPSFAGPPPEDTPSMAQIAQDRVCEGDVRSLCSEVRDPRPGDDRVLACLEKHETQLTEACRKNVESHQKTQ